MTSVNDRRVQLYREQIDVDQAALTALARIARYGLGTPDVGVVLLMLIESLENMAKNMKAALERSTIDGDPPLIAHQEIDELAIRETMKYDTAFRDLIDKHRSGNA